MLYKLTGLNENKKLPDTWQKAGGNRILLPYKQLEPLLHYFSLTSDQLDDFASCYQTIQNDSDLIDALLQLSYALFEFEYEWADIFSWPRMSNMPMFYLCVLMQKAPECISFWKHKAVSDDILVATFSDIPLWLNRHKKEYDCYGISGVSWLKYHFTSSILRIGRLQFMPSTFYWDHIQDECGIRSGDAVIDIHIPGDGGLQADEVRQSIFDARSLFSRVYPDTNFKAFVCRSWLFDSQLKSYLPETSNIITFQNMFTLYPDPNTNAEDIINMVLGETYRDRPLDFSPRSTLEKAIVDHIKKGGTWGTALGILK